MSSCAHALRVELGTQKLKQSLSQNLQQRYALTKFVAPKDVGSILAKADVVVARAGINTITELIFFGKPSLLIPIPFSQKDEQRKNALFMESLGLAEVIPQNILNSDKLYKVVSSMVGNKLQYSKHVVEARKVVSIDAVKKIIEVIKVCGK